MAIFLKTVFLYRTPPVAASELKSSISNANLDKNEKLFLYLDASHANQTNNFFNMLLMSTILKRKQMRKNVILRAYNRAIYLDQTQAICRKNKQPKVHM